METPAAPPPPPEPVEIVAAPARAGVPRFDSPNILWYFGAITATIASVAVISQVGSAHRGAWILLVSLAFCAGAAALSAFALSTGCWVPGGVLATAAVGIFPAVANGFEHLIGVAPKDAQSLDPFRNFSGATFALPAVTVAASLTAFWLVRFGFVLFPATLASLLALQLLLPVFVSNPNVDDNIVTLLVTGAAFVVVGMLLDARSHRAAAFWWHVVGLFAIAVGLVYYVGRSAANAVLPVGSTHHHAWAWVAMLVIGAALLLASFPLRRATWAAFGVAGVYTPVLHYVDDWSGSWHFPLLMVFVGVGLVFLGAVLDMFGAAWPQRLSRQIAPHPPE